MRLLVTGDNGFIGRFVREHHRREFVSIVMVPIHPGDLEKLAPRPER